MTEEENIKTPGIESDNKETGFWGFLRGIFTSTVEEEQPEDAKDDAQNSKGFFSQLKFGSDPLKGQSVETRIPLKHKFLSNQTLRILQWAIDQTSASLDQFVEPIDGSNIDLTSLWHGELHLRSIQVKLASLLNTYLKMPLPFSPLMTYIGGLDLSIPFNIFDSSVSVDISDVLIVLEMKDAEAILSSEINNYGDLVDKWLATIENVLLHDESLCYWSLISNGDGKIVDFALKMGLKIGEKAIVNVNNLHIRIEDVTTSKFALGFKIGQLRIRPPHCQSPAGSLGKAIQITDLSIYSNPLEIRSEENLGNELKVFQSLHSTDGYFPSTGAPRFGGTEVSTSSKNETKTLTNVAERSYAIDGRIPFAVQVQEFTEIKLMNPSTGKWEFMEEYAAMNGADSAARLYRHCKDGRYLRDSHIPRPKGTTVKTPMSMREILASNPLSGYRHPLKSSHSTDVLIRGRLEPLMAPNISVMPDKIEDFALFIQHYGDDDKTFQDHIVLGWSCQMDLMINLLNHSKLIDNSPNSDSVEGPVDSVWNSFKSYFKSENHKTHLTPDTDAEPRMKAFKDLALIDVSVASKAFIFSILPHQINSILSFGGALARFATSLSLISKSKLVYSSHCASEEMETVYEKYWPVKLLLVSGDVDGFSPLKLLRANLESISLQRKALPTPKGLRTMNSRVNGPLTDRKISHKGSSLRFNVNPVDMKRHNHLSESPRRFNRDRLLYSLGLPSWIIDAVQSVEDGVYQYQLAVIMWCYRFELAYPATYITSLRRKIVRKLVTGQYSSGRDIRSLYLNLTRDEKLRQMDTLICCGDIYTDLSSECLDLEMIIKKLASDPLSRDANRDRNLLKALLLARPATEVTKIVTIQQQPSTLVSLTLAIDDAQLIIISQGSLHSESSPKSEGRKSPRKQTSPADQTPELVDCIPSGQARDSSDIVLSLKGLEVTCSVPNENLIRATPAELCCAVEVHELSLFYLGGHFPPSYPIRYYSKRIDEQLSKSVPGKVLIQEAYSKLTGGQTPLFTTDPFLYREDGHTKVVIPGDKKTLQPKDGREGQYLASLIWTRVAIPPSVQMIFCIDTGYLSLPRFDRLGGLSMNVESDSEQEKNWQFYTPPEESESTEVHSIPSLDEAQYDYDNPILVNASRVKQRRSIYALGFQMDMLMDDASPDMDIIIHGTGPLTFFMEPDTVESIIRDNLSPIVEVLHGSLISKRRDMSTLANLHRPKLVTPSATGTIKLQVTLDHFINAHVLHESDDALSSSQLYLKGCDKGPLRLDLVLGPRPIEGGCVNQDVKCRLPLIESSQQELVKLTVMPPRSIEIQLLGRSDSLQRMHNLKVYPFHSYPRQYMETRQFVSVYHRLHPFISYPRDIITMSQVTIYNLRRIGVKNVPLAQKLKSISNELNFMANETIAADVGDSSDHGTHKDQWPPAPPSGTTDASDDHSDSKAKSIIRMRSSVMAGYKKSLSGNASIMKIQFQGSEGVCEAVSLKSSVVGHSNQSDIAVSLDSIKLSLDESKLIALVGILECWIYIGTSPGVVALNDRLHSLNITAKDIDARKQAIQMRFTLERHDGYPLHRFSITPPRYKKKTNDSCVVTGSKKQFNLCRSTFSDGLQDAEIEEDDSSQFRRVKEWEIQLYEDLVPYLGTRRLSLLRSIILPSRMMLSVNIKHITLKIKCQITDHLILSMPLSIIERVQQERNPNLSPSHGHSTPNAPPSFSRFNTQRGLSTVFNRGFSRVDDTMKLYGDGLERDRYRDGREMPTSSLFGQSEFEQKLIDRGGYATPGIGSDLRDWPQHVSLDHPIPLIEFKMEAISVNGLAASNGAMNLRANLKSMSLIDCTNTENRAWSKHILKFYPDVMTKPACPSDLIRKDGGTKKSSSGWLNDSHSAESDSGGAIDIQMTSVCSYERDPLFSWMAIYKHLSLFEIMSYLDRFSDPIKLILNDHQLTVNVTMPHNLVITLDPEYVSYIFIWAQKWYFLLIGTSLNSHEVANQQRMDHVETDYVASVLFTLEADEQDWQRRMKPFLCPFGQRLAEGREDFEPRKVKSRRATREDCSAAVDGNLYSNKVQIFHESRCAYEVRMTISLKVNLLEVRILSEPPKPFILPTKLPHRPSDMNEVLRRSLANSDSSPSKRRNISVKLPLESSSDTGFKFNCFVPAPVMSSVSMVIQTSWCCRTKRPSLEDADLSDPSPSLHEYVHQFKDVKEIKSAVDFLLPGEASSEGPGNLVNCLFQDSEDLLGQIAECNVQPDSTIKPLDAERPPPDLQSDPPPVPAEPPRSLNGVLFSSSLNNGLFSSITTESSPTHEGSSDDDLPMSSSALLNRSARTQESSFRPETLGGVSAARTFDRASTAPFTQLECPMVWAHDAHPIYLKSIQCHINHSDVLLPLPPPWSQMIINLENEFTKQSALKNDLTPEELIPGAQKTLAVAYQACVQLRTLFCLLNDDRILPKPVGQSSFFIRRMTNTMHFINLSINHISVLIEPPIYYPPMSRYILPSQLPVEASSQYHNIICNQHHTSEYCLSDPLISPFSIHINLNAKIPEYRRLLEHLYLPRTTSLFPKHPFLPPRMTFMHNPDYLSFPHGQQPGPMVLGGNLSITLSEIAVDLNPQNTSRLTVMAWYVSSLATAVTVEKNHDKGTFCSSRNELHSIRNALMSLNVEEKRGLQFTRRSKRNSKKLTAVHHRILIDEEVVPVVASCRGDFTLNDVNHVLSRVISNLDVLVRLKSVEVCVTNRCYSRDPVNRKFMNTTSASASTPSHCEVPCCPRTAVWHMSNPFSYLLDRRGTIANSDRSCGDLFKSSDDEHYLKLCLTDGSLSWSGSMYKEAIGSGDQLISPASTNAALMTIYEKPKGKLRVWKQSISDTIDEAKRRSVFMSSTEPMNDTRTRETIPIKLSLKLHVIYGVADARPQFLVEPSSLDAKLLLHDEDVCPDIRATLSWINVTISPELLDFVMKVLYDQLLGLLVHMSSFHIIENSRMQKEADHRAERQKDILQEVISAQTSYQEKLRKGDAGALESHTGKEPWKDLLELYSGSFRHSAFVNPTPLTSTAGLNRQKIVIDSSNFRVRPRFFDTVQYAVLEGRGNSLYSPCRSHVLHWHLMDVLFRMVQTLPNRLALPNGLVKRLTRDLYSQCSYIQDVDSRTMTVKDINKLISVPHIISQPSPRRRLLVTLPDATSESSPGTGLRPKVLFIRDQPELISNSTDMKHSSNTRPENLHEDQHPLRFHNHLGQTISLDFDAREDRAMFGVVNNIHVQPNCWCPIASSLNEGVAVNDLNSSRSVAGVLNSKVRPKLEWITPFSIRIEMWDGVYELTSDDHLQDAFIHVKNRQIITEILCRWSPSVMDFTQDIIGEFRLDSDYVLEPYHVTFMLVQSEPKSSASQKGKSSASQKNPKAIPHSFDPIRYSDHVPLNLLIFPIIKQSSKKRTVDTMTSKVLDGDAVVEWRFHLTSSTSIINHHLNLAPTIQNILVARNMKSPQLELLNFDILLFNQIRKKRHLKSSRTLTGFTDIVSADCMDSTNKSIVSASAELVSVWRRTLSKTKPRRFVNDVSVANHSALVEEKSDVEAIHQISGYIAYHVLQGENHKVALDSQIPNMFKQLLASVVPNGGRLNNHRMPITDVNDALGDAAPPGDVRSRVNRLHSSSSVLPANPLSLAGESSRRRSRKHNTRFGTSANSVNCEDRVMRKDRHVRPIRVDPAEVMAFKWLTAHLNSLRQKVNNDLSWEPQQRTEQEANRNRIFHFNRKIFSTLDPLEEETESSEQTRHVPSSVVVDPSPVAPSFSSNTSSDTMGTPYSCDASELEACVELLSSILDFDSISRKAVRASRSAMEVTLPPVLSSHDSLHHLDTQRTDASTVVPRIPYPASESEDLTPVPFHAMKFEELYRLIRPPSMWNKEGDRWIETKHSKLYVEMVLRLLTAFTIVLNTAPMESGSNVLQVTTMTSASSPRDDSDKWLAMFPTTTFNGPADRHAFPVSMKPLHVNTPVPSPTAIQSVEPEGKVSVVHSVGDAIVYLPLHWFALSDTTLTMSGSQSAHPIASLSFWDVIFASSQDMSIHPTRWNSTKTQQPCGVSRRRISSRGDVLANPRLAHSLSETTQISGMSRVFGDTVLDESWSSPMRTDRSPRVAEEEADVLRFVDAIPEGMLELARVMTEYIWEKKSNAGLDSRQKLVETKWKDIQNEVASRVGHSEPIMIELDLTGNHESCPSRHATGSRSRSGSSTADAVHGRSKPSNLAGPRGGIRLAASVAFSSRRPAGDSPLSCDDFQETIILLENSLKIENCLLYPISIKFRQSPDDGGRRRSVPSPSSNSRIGSEGYVSRKTLGLNTFHLNRVKVKDGGGGDWNEKTVEPLRSLCLPRVPVNGQISVGMNSRYTNPFSITTPSKRFIASSVRWHELKHTHRGSEDEHAAPLSIRVKISAGRENKQSPHSIEITENGFIAFGQHNSYLLTISCEYSIVNRLRNEMLLERMAFSESERMKVKISNDSAIQSVTGSVKLFPTVPVVICRERASTMWVISCDADVLALSLNYVDYEGRYGYGDRESTLHDRGLSNRLRSSPFELENIIGHRLINFPATPRSPRLSFRLCSKKEIANQVEMQRLELIPKWMLVNNKSITVYLREYKYTNWNRGKISDKKKNDISQVEYSQEGYIEPISKQACRAEVVRLNPGDCVEFHPQFHPVKKDRLTVQISCLPHVARDLSASPGSPVMDSTVFNRGNTDENWSSAMWSSRIELRPNTLKKHIVRHPAPTADNSMLVGDFCVSSLVCEEKIDPQVISISIRDVEVPEFRIVNLSSVALGLSQTTVDGPFEVLLPCLSNKLFSKHLHHSSSQTKDTAWRHETVRCFLAAKQYLTTSSPDQIVQHECLVNLLQYLAFDAYPYHPYNIMHRGQNWNMWLCPIDGSFDDQNQSVKELASRKESDFIRRANFIKQLITECPTPLKRHEQLDKWKQQATSGNIAKLNLNLSFERNSYRQIKEMPPVLEVFSLCYEPPHSNKVSFHRVCLKLVHTPGTKWVIIQDYLPLASPNEFYLKTASGDPSAHPMRDNSSIIHLGMSVIADSRISTSSPVLAEHRQSIVRLLVQYFNVASVLETQHSSNLIDSSSIQLGDNDHQAEGRVTASHDQDDDKFRMAAIRAILDGAHSPLQLLVLSDALMIFPDDKSKDLLRERYWEELSIDLEVLEKEIAHCGGLSHLLELLGCQYQTSSMAGQGLMKWVEKAFGTRSGGLRMSSTIIIPSKAVAKRNVATHRVSRKLNLFRMPSMFLVIKGIGISLVRFTAPDSSTQSDSNWSGGSRGRSGHGAQGKSSSSKIKPHEVIYISLVLPLASYCEHLATDGTGNKARVTISLGWCQIDSHLPNTTAPQILQPSRSERSFVVDPKTSIFQYPESREIGIQLARQSRMDYWLGQPFLNLSVEMKTDAFQAGSGVSIEKLSISIIPLEVIIDGVNFRALLKWVDLAVQRMDDPGSVAPYQSSPCFNMVNPMPSVTGEGGELHLHIEALEISKLSILFSFKPDQGSGLDKAHQPTALKHSAHHHAVSPSEPLETDSLRAISRYFERSSLFSMNETPITFDKVVMKQIGGSISSIVLSLGKEYVNLEIKQVKHTLGLGLNVVTSSEFLGGPRSAMKHAKAGTFEVWWYWLKLSTVNTSNQRSLEKPLSPILECMKAHGVCLRGYTATVFEVASTMTRFWETLLASGIGAQYCEHSVYPGAREILKPVDKNPFSGFLSGLRSAIITGGLAVVNSVYLPAHAWSHVSFSRSSAGTHATVAFDSPEELSSIVAPTHSNPIPDMIQTTERDGEGREPSATTSEEQVFYEENLKGLVAVEDERVRDETRGGVKAVKAGLLTVQALAGLAVSPFVCACQVLNRTAAGLQAAVAQATPPSHLKIRLTRPMDIPYLPSSFDPLMSHLINSSREWHQLMWSTYSLGRDINPNDLIFITYLYSPVDEKNYYSSGADVDVDASDVNAAVQEASDTKDQTHRQTVRRVMTGRRRESRILGRCSFLLLRGQGTYLRLKIGQINPNTSKEPPMMNRDRFQKETRTRDKGTEYIIDYGGWFNEANIAEIRLCSSPPPGQSDRMLLPAGAEAHCERSPSWYIWFKSYTSNIERKNYEEKISKCQQMPDSRSETAYLDKISFELHRSDLNDSQEDPRPSDPSLPRAHRSTSFRRRSPHSSGTLTRSLKIRRFASRQSIRRSSTSSSTPLDNEPKHRLRLHHLSHHRRRSEINFDLSEAMTLSSNRNRCHSETSMSRRGLPRGSERAHSVFNVSVEDVSNLAEWQFVPVRNVMLGLSIIRFIESMRNSDEVYD
eukprot:GHVH01014077.1.p1 GENE.GHVH01014077.1~~GHVH01014077.1.p1  ORF type:complete len:6290 (+),score=882.53 GHVH01014077.1:82-18951(+)